MASNALKSWIKGNPRLKRTALMLMRMVAAFNPPDTLRALPRYVEFLSDLRRFTHAGGSVALFDWYPCLHDKTMSTVFDTHYLHQAAWAARRIFEHRPAHHIDIASQVSFVAQLAAFTEVSFVDIRPPQLTLPGLNVLRGLITALPFDDGSVSSISCLHVIEHIGLGRYGDQIDPNGPEKACREITRILESGGNAYISVPIGRPRVSFNSHRVFGAAEVSRLFEGLELREMSMIDVPGNLVANVDFSRVDIRESEGGMDFGLGLFHFRKPGSSK